MNNFKWGRSRVTRLGNKNNSIFHVDIFNFDVVYHVKLSFDLESINLFEELWTFMITVIRLC